MKVRGYCVLTFADVCDIMSDLVKCFALLKKLKLESTPNIPFIPFRKSKYYQQCKLIA